MKPKFNFSLSVLTGSAARLRDALVDPAYSTAMTERLGAGFLAALDEKLDALPGASQQQGGQTTKVADLTKDQQAAFEEVERLTAGARRTAKLAFPGDATRLRTEFQVGIDEPKTLAAELDRAGIILASLGVHATALAAKGWIARDTSALKDAIALLGGKDLQQEAALDDRLDLTGEKVALANALYADCLTIQNAARLEYPAKVQGQPANATARARFLLDEFPPRDRTAPDGGTQGNTPPPTPPPAA